MKAENRKSWHRLAASWAIASLATCFVAGSSRGQDTPPPIPDQEQPEVLTRGPVHEAFAEPVNLQYQDAQVAPTEPPANIEEVPPDERPEGDQYVWIPGYWSWDAERTNYIWISACWRAAPPKMSWTPGYWAPATGGFEWVAGFWAPNDAQDVEYLPTPPVPDGIEPPGPPPTVDDVWVPACSYWADGKYVDRPGYWLKTQPGWMWVASHYVWSPRGYVFAAGHWDYPLEDRGVLFAPVAISHDAYSRSGYTYSPSVVVDTDVLSANLFVSLRYSHYFFGDYYDDDSAQVGILPWFDHRSSKTWYDPMYEYDRASLRVSVTDWDQRERHDFDARRADVNLRPPKTYRDLETRIAKAPADQRENIQVVQSFKTVVNNTTVNNTTINNNRTTVNNDRTTVNNNKNVSKVKFQKIDASTQKQIVAQAASSKKLGDQRKGWEAPEKTAANQAKPAAALQAAPKGAEPQLATERKAPAVEPAAKPEAAPAERGRGPAAQPEAKPAPIPEERARGNATPQSDAKPSPTPAEQGRDAATPAPERRPAAAQRETRAAQPERVKIPDARPSGAKVAAGAEKAPPPQPSDEVKRKGDTKETPKAEEKPTTQPDRRGR